MTDEILESLTTFVEGFSFKDISADGLVAAKRRILDSVGCMIAGMASPAGQIVRERASNTFGNPSATVVGLEAKSTVDMAAFANTAMLRYWDFNDTGARGGHLSEMLPGVLAMSDAVAADGASTLLACVIAYEVQSALGAARTSGGTGWDYATMGAVSVALATGKLLGLTRDQLGHAAAIAAISNISTWASRFGKISLWMNCTSAVANKNGIFAALIARDGMTGPEQPFVGKDGIMQMVTKDRFTVDLPLPYEKELAVQKSSLKMFPATDAMQGPVEMMLQLRERVSIEDIEEIRVDSFSVHYGENGERINPEMWDPQTREMADHSFPFTMAVALVDGSLTMDSYSEQKIKDPALRPIMELVSIYSSKELQKRLPAEKPSKITIRLRSGEVIEQETSQPYGHPLNAPTDEKLKEKFASLSRLSTNDEDAVRRISDSIWNLEAVTSLRDVFETLGKLRPA